MTQYIGQLHISDYQEVSGQVTGTIFVLKGGHLVLHGQASGGVIIDEGGEAVIYGQSSRNVVNNGKLKLLGQVSGSILGNRPTNLHELNERQVVGNDSPVPISGKDGYHFTTTNTVHL